MLVNGGALRHEGVDVSDAYSQLDLAARQRLTYLNLLGSNVQ